MAYVRFILRLLTIGTVALGLVSAPLYTNAESANASTAIKLNHEHLTMLGQGFPDHDRTSPAKPHAVGQTCCHPGCIMAIVPGFASLTTALLPWITVPIPRDRRRSPVPSSGPDRPPKLA